MQQLYLLFFYQKYENYIACIIFIIIILNQINISSIESVMLASNDYTTIGNSLKELRRERNFSRTDVAQQLKMREFYIQAIENGKVEQFPFKVHFYSYIKSYYDFLGGCDKNMLSSLKADNENLCLLPRNMVSDQEFKPSRLMIFLSVSILCLLIIIYGNF